MQKCHRTFERDFPTNKSQCFNLGRKSKNRVISQLRTVRAERQSKRLPEGNSLKFTALSMFVRVMTVEVAAGQTPVTSSELFLLRISEAQVSTRPTAGPNNVSNCMIVYPDGRLHLELRSLMEKPASPHTRRRFRTRNSRLSGLFSIRIP
jgi:hypothetical protein